jgi:SAM-dependent methyltransferase
MLREHLDESHGAASRTEKERLLQIDWLCAKLGLQPGMRILDVTCGPGLYAVEFARRGCMVTGIDFSPAAIRYARSLAETAGVAERCTFIEADVRTVDFGALTAGFDAALFLYGQLAVFPKVEAEALLTQISQTLRPGGRFAADLLDQARVDKQHNTWWYTDDAGLWGDAPYLHLGERFWDAEQELSIERFLVLHLATGQLDEVILCDQTYAIPTMTATLQTANFTAIEHYANWAELPLYDASEWIVYIAEK